MNEYEKEELSREEMNQAQPGPDMGPESQPEPEPETQPEGASPVEPEDIPEQTFSSAPEPERQYQQKFGQQYPQYPSYPPPPPPPGAFGGAPWPQYGYGPTTTGWQQPQWQQPYSSGGTSRQSGGYRPQEPTPPRRKKTPEPAEVAEVFAETFEGFDAAPVKKKKHRFLRVLLGLAAVLVVLSVLGMAGYGAFAALTGENPLSGRFEPISGSAETNPGGNPVPDVVINDRPQGEDRYDGTEEGTLSNNAIFNKVSPSVVGVVARLGDGFYGDSSQGSGIIMSEDGYIITNAHVVEGATSYEVVLTDGQSYQAQLVGADRNSDLAVLKVSATGLAYAEFGNSDQAQVGERVCVIGNPGGLRFQNSLTVGYISALKRTISTGGYSIDCLQTDAAVNPGNSGGPLINAYGQVIGITSAKIALTDYEGICFAIPISDAMPILKQLIADGKVTGRAMLGITAKAVQASEAEFYEIPLGLWVVSVTPGADIGAKGIREGDIITHIEDTPIYSLDACSNVLKNHKPGDTVTITVFRRENSMTDTTFKADIELQGS